MINPLTIDRVIEEINKIFWIDIKERKKNTEYIHGRAIFFYIGKKYYNLTPTKLAKTLGVDRAAVYNSVKKYDFEFSRDKVFIQKQNYVIETLGLEQNDYDFVKKPKKKVLNTFTSEQVNFIDYLIQEKTNDLESDVNRLIGQVYQLQHKVRKITKEQ